jgi:hypothetical protein
MEVHGNCTSRLHAHWPGSWSGGAACVSRLVCTEAIEGLMKELESRGKSTNPASKGAPSTNRPPPTVEQLRAMPTDELVKMLMSPDMARPMNESLRQLIIRVLQQREGNIFVQRLLSKGSSPKAT